jgi:hypothetical protein
MKPKLLTPSTDKTGWKSGRLTVLKFSRYVDNPGVKTRTALWLCQCECGNMIEVRNCNLNSKATKSCGCMLVEHIKAVGQAKISDKSSFKHLYNGYKREALKMNREFKLNEDEFRKLTSSDCHYCGIGPSKEIKGNGKKIFKGGSYKYNGVDRFDNNKGYEMNNCVPCCWKCNNAKNNMSISEFKEWINKIYNYYIQFHPTIKAPLSN